ncbi:MAG TPA: hypothetical protein PKC62_02925 [Ferruginibacter sp.]|nr:hypothetical protein [Ferruginibacter sp.]HMU24026.1 hypothetical protein [Ferruginibacter sp.]HRD42597.1 hypothetical protein [Ferruginibacter sp.]
MKKNRPSIFALIAKSIAESINSLFFSHDRDFQRLKNFIAS